MEQGKQKESVESLQKKVALIKKNYINLLSNKNELFLNGVKQIEEESEKRAKVITEGSECELAAAETAYNSQVDTIHSDFQKEKKEVEEQMFQIIQYKLRALNNEFPLAMSEIMKHKTNLKEPLRKLSSSSSKGHTLRVKESSECLLSKKQINEDMSEVNSGEKPYLISNGIITQGKKTYSTGTNCEIYINNEGPFSGTIGDVSSDSFQFVADGCNSTEIPLQALNIGIAKLV